MALLFKEQQDNASVARKETSSLPSVSASGGAKPSPFITSNKENRMILNNVKVKWARVGSNPATKYASDETEWTVDCEVSAEQSK